MRLTAKADHGHTAGMSMNQKKGGNVTTAEIVTTTATPEVAQAATIKDFAVFTCLYVIMFFTVLVYLDMCLKFLVFYIYCVNFFGGTFALSK